MERNTGQGNTKENNNGRGNLDCNETTVRIFARTRAITPGQSSVCNGCSDCEKWSDTA